MIRVNIDENHSKNGERKFLVEKVGHTLRILNPLQNLAPALLKVLGENVPITSTLYPLLLKYSAKKLILVQAACG